jgi:hypothetical protein
MLFKENAMPCYVYFYLSFPIVVLPDLNNTKVEDYYKCLIYSSYLLPGKLTYQELGIAKLSGFREWLSFHSLIAGSENASKMIIFAHHHKVLDGVQVHFSSVSSCN